MDICKRLTSTNINDYIELTQELENENIDSKIVLNMSTVLSLKNIRSLEIEYFNKCDGSGAAFKLFELLLRSPRSKTWGLLGSDLIELLQYWLDAVRKHLISHHIHWWTFLKQILGFIKEIRQKDQALSNILVQETAESMLDLATSGKPEVNQRYEILHTFNLYCAESSREVRLNLRTQFEPYFIRLATVMATCGHLPTQFACLETLLRWLQPRHEAATRRDAANKWFLPHLYSRDATDIFLKRTWVNFIQDARDFLNCHNMSNNLVTSLICRKLSVGKVVLVSGKEKRPSWLDINSDSVSVLLEPQHAARDASCRALSLRPAQARLLSMYRESSEVKISILMLEPPSILPSSTESFDEHECDVTAVISSRADLPRVHHALRGLFRDKYQAMLDVHDTTNLSPQRLSSGRRRNSTDDKRFSNIKEKRRKRSGYIVRPRNFATLKSPSTASTTSLAQLHDKLAALPYYEFTKEPLGVCARPELSVVSEQSESQISNSLESNSTLKIRRCAVFDRSFRSCIHDKQYQSDGETTRFKTGNSVFDDQSTNDTSNVKGSQSDNEYVRKSAEDDPRRGVSSLFAATVGSVDVSVIDATIERLPKEKDLNTDNLIELLVQEALEAKGIGEKEQLLDSGVITGDGKKTLEVLDTETIEDTQYIGTKTAHVTTPKILTVVSKSTSDESNTEAINETPVNYVNVRKRNQRKQSEKKHETLEKVNKNAAFDVKAVEDFFSQHFAENQMGDLIISPTLAKKINETSSETSEECLLDRDFDILDEQIPNLEIINCLNSIVDKVCSEFDKCSEYLDKEGPESKILHMAKNMTSEAKEKLSPDVNKSTDVSKGKKKQNTAKTIKLKFTKKQKVYKSKAKRKLEMEPTSKMSTIIEDNNESDENKIATSDTNKQSIENDTKKDTSLTKRKRKLYSPKDVDIHLRNTINEDSSSNKPLEVNQSDNEDIALAVLKKDKLSTSKSTATCYKEIEKDRQKFRKTRAQRLKAKMSPQSPKTKRLNDVFEHLKDNIESNENIILVDRKSDKDIAIFNFTSDSEDEDFKQKKIEIQKRTSTTTVGSCTSVMSTRRGRKKKVNDTETAKDSSNETTSKPKQKRVTKRKNTKPNARKVKIDSPIDLIDERMREAAPEALNTSFVHENVDSTNITVKDDEPMIQIPELEPILNDNVKVDPVKKKGKATKKDKNNAQTKVEKKPLQIIRDDDRTVSPLPGLLIETELDKIDADESLTTNLVHKFQRIYKDGPDAYDTTTQNLLSDNERGNSPQMNITDELGKAFDGDNLNSNEEKNISKTSDNKKYSSDINTIDNTINSDNATDISKIGSSKTKRNKLRLKTNKTRSVKSDSIKNDGSENKAIRKVKVEKSDSQKSKIKPKSSIQEIVCDEIICLDTEIMTRSKSAKSRSKSREVEPIDMSSSDIKSERSIATDGITAHGDLNEVPPSPKLLSQKLMPREIYDMDQTTRDYFVELNRKVNLSDNTNESSSIGKHKKTRSEIEEVKSIISSVEQKSVKVNNIDHNYDIDKWLPSIRDSESDSPSESSRKSKSPVVSLTKLTSEDISKWLPSTKTTPESSFETANKVKELQRCPIIAKARKSQISPIQIDDFLTKRTSNCNVLPKRVLNLDSSKSKDVTYSQIEDILPIKKLKQNKSYLKPTHESSPTSRASKSEDSPVKMPSKRSPVAKPIDGKRRKLDLDLGLEVDISECRQSSNVDDWLRKISASCTVDNIDASGDALQNLMEKLDTTLAEIHQTTTKDFISLFVDAHKQLTDLKAERRQLYQETALGILTNVTQLIDRQFAEMDRRAEERDSRFMSWLKQRASDVLRQDCRQKKAMVMLLREDAQAVADHVARSQSVTQD